MNNEEKKSFFVKESDMKINGLYHLKSPFKRIKMKDPVIRVKAIDYENETITIIGENHPTYQNKATYKFGINKYVEINENFDILPEKEFVDYTYIIENSVVLKMIAGHKDFYLCTIEHIRYYVNKKKFRIFVESYYWEKYRIRNNNFISSSCELLQALDCRNINPLTKIVKRQLGTINNIDNKIKAKEDLELYKEEINYLDIADENGILYDKDNYVITDVEGDEIIGYISNSPIAELIRLTTCEKYFHLREIYTSDFLKNIKTQNDIISKSFKEETSLFPHSIYYGMTVHIDRNIRRILTTEQNNLYRCGLLKTITIIFHISLNHIDFKEFSRTEQMLLISILDIEARTKRLTELGYISEITSQVLDMNLDFNIQKKILSFINSPNQSDFYHDKDSRHIKTRNARCIESNSK